MFISSGYSAHTLSVASGTEHHHHAAHVVGRSRDRDGAAGRESRLFGFDLELGRAQAVQVNDVALDRALAARPDPLTQALEHEPVGTLANRGGLTRVDDAVELAHVGKRQRKRIIRSEV